MNQEIIKAKIEEKPVYYSEDELDLIVQTKDRKIPFKVSVKTVKETINVLKNKKAESEESIKRIEEEIQENKQWLEDIKPDLLNINYFKFEE